MVKVSIEVRSGAARFNVAVQAQSIQQAVSLVKERHSKCTLKARFPIESESFLVEDQSVRRRIVDLEEPARVAA
jgi:hypothetical protein